MKKKSYMNTKGIITEGVLEKILKYLVKGRVSKVQDMFKDNPWLDKATKDYKKAHDKYIKQLKKSGIKS